MKKEHNENGKVVLVGAGPGDPELITIKGIKFLRAADVVLYDYLANKKLLDYCKPEVEKIYVGKMAGIHSLTQDEINQLLVAKAKEQKLVVRLKGGDPFIFGRGGEEILALVREGIKFEVVPGITAGIAALSYAGIPATQRGVATSVSFITGHEDPTKVDSGLNWQAIAHIQGTLVFYMGVKNLATIVQKLIEHGKPPTMPVTLIRWGTFPSQQTIVGTLNSIVKHAKERSFRPPALIVVGDVVRNRNTMNWFERKLLFGKRIVITRARAQSSELERQLSELGAQVLEVPSIRIVPPQSWQPLDDAITNLERYDWIVFTSVNGVESFFQRLLKPGSDSRKLHNAKIAAIGSTTVKQLRQYGILADLQPPKFVAEALIEALQKQTEISGKHFLLPCAEPARPVFKDELLKAGAELNEVVAYRTVTESDQGEKTIKQIQAGQVDLITFTSSSTVKNFAKLIGTDQINNLKNVTVASIGPITCQTALDHGFNPKIMPTEYTIPALVQAVVNYYSKIGKDLS